MGNLRYGGVDFEFDDRTLLHLRAAVIAKLRRGGSFTLAYTRHVRTGSGRRALWIHPAVPLRFDIDSAQAAGSLNREWVQQLTNTGNAGEMFLTDEPGTRQDPPAPIEPEPLPTASKYS